MLGICTIQRDRSPWLAEWLAFHYVVGFRKFFFYAHCCSDDTVLKLRTFASVLDLTCFEIKDEMDFVQLRSYQHAYDNFGDQVDWMAFVDGDEFLFPVEKMTLQEVLADYDDQEISALAAYWVCYGSGGHIREPDGLLIDNYQERPDINFIRNRHIKSIVKGRQKIIANVNSHLFVTQSGTYDELMRPVNHGFMKDLLPSHQKLRINHYICQSYEYYMSMKREAGMADAGAATRRSDDWWPLHDKNEVHDGDILKFRAQVVDKMAEMTDVLEYNPNSDQARVHLGSGLEQQGRYDDTKEQNSLLVDKQGAVLPYARKERVSKGTGNSSMPLVSIVIPTHNRPDYFELALQSALAQDYENIEIIVSDNSSDDLTRMRIEPYLEEFPYICYSRVPGYPVQDNFRNCYELARGDFINYLMDDDLFHPAKIRKMMAYMIQPNVSLVTSFRQLIDVEGRFMSQIPGTERLFDSETMIGGKSLGETILTQGMNMVGEPTTALFRKADVDGCFSVFAGKEYIVLSDVATWLSILSHKDCVYLPEPLSYFRIHDGQDQRSGTMKLKVCVEWLQLFCDAYEHKNFFNRTGVHDLLTSKLVTALWFLSSEHEKIKAGAYELEKIHAVIRQATSILLGN